METTVRTVKVGDIFYESWGYDQTNIDFVQVVSISPTGKTVKCQMAGKEHTDGEHIKPSKPFGIVFRLYVRQGYQGATILVGSYPFVQGENVLGGWREGRFYPYEKPLYETPFGMGH